jgi:biopolymer transport protein ExbD
MLVLLIIFMVSAPPSTLAIKVDLPPNEPTVLNVKSKPTYIWIREDRQIMITDKPTTLATLASDLTASFNVPKPRDQSVLIRADRLVRYDDFITVVNTLQANGFYKVSLILEGGEAPTPAAASPAA